MIDLNNRLSERIALVTGGAGGQGAAHTERLAREGARVYFADVNERAGRDIEQRLRDNQLDVHFRVLDVSSLENWESLAADLEATEGHLDILVNNAGILADVFDAVETTPEAWQRTIDINQKSIFLSYRTMVPLLRKSSHASIVNTSSIFGLVGAPGYISYIASKGAVTTMTKSGAATYGPEGIRVNSIHPGYIDTQMLRDEFAGLGDGAEEAVLATIPMGRLSAANEISPAVAFLSSDDASYISGAELLIDGALLATR